jgi:large subunit ribosomal protein L9
MKIILLSDVASLGKKDDVVEVSAGYARNSLIPKHLGEEATPANLNNLKLRKKHEAKIEKENLEKALELKKKIEDWKVEVSIKTGEGGRVFGSVSTKEIAEAAEKQYGVKIDKKKLECDVPVKAPGGYDVNVRLHRDVTAVMHVHVSGTN